MNVNRQSFLMKGVVTDEDGESIIGATVMIGGTSKGTAVSYTHLDVYKRQGQRELAIANIVRSIYIVMLIPVQALSTTTNSLVSNLIGRIKPIILHSICCI